jgi:hypothetical protein
MVMNVPATVEKLRSLTDRYSGKALRISHAP